MSSGSGIGMTPGELVIERRRLERAGQSTATIDQHISAESVTRVGAALDRRARLLKDKEFVRRYTDGSIEAEDEVNALNKIIAGVDNAPEGSAT